MRRSTRSRPLRAARAPGEITYLDAFQVSKHDLPVGLNGEGQGIKYAVIFVDGYSKFKRIYFCKSQADIPKLLKFWISELGLAAHVGGHFLLGRGWRRYVHTDGGKPMNSEAFAKVLLEFGLAANVTSCPHHPSSNGVAERSFETLAADVRAALESTGIAKRLWHWAARNSVARRNLLAVQAVVDKETGVTRYVTPYELFFNRRPDLTHLVSWGSPCRVLALGPTLRAKGKLSMPSLKGRVIGHGYDGVQIDKAWRYILGHIVLLEDGRVTYSQHVQIDERPAIEGGSVPSFDKFGSEATAEFFDAEVESTIAAANVEHEHFGPRGADESSGNFIESASNDESSGDFIESAPKPTLPLAHDPLRKDRASRSGAAARSSTPAAAPAARSARGSARAPPAAARSSTPEAAPAARGRHVTPTPAAEPPREQAHARPATTAYLDGSTVIIPNSYKQAIASEHAVQWIAAMNEHLVMHKKMGTYKPKVVHKDTAILPCRWVFAVKTDNASQVIRFKARTVLWGCRQRQGVDFEEVFSPAARGEQIKLMITAGAIMYGKSLKSGQKLHLTRLLNKGDVTDAFLNSLLVEKGVLSEFPPGQDSGVAAPAGFKVAAEQLRAHPGLKQSGRAWFLNIRARLLEQGWEQSPCAPSVFLREEPSGGWVAIALYVDDMLILNASSNELAARELVEKLKLHFEIKLQEELSKFLGAEYDITDEGIHLHLNQYVTGILGRFGMADCRPVSTPEISGTSGINSFGGDAVANAPDETLLNRKDTTLYQEIVGATMFCCTTCRPDLAHAVGMLARRMSLPRVCDMGSASRVLRYLRGTPKLGLLFRFEQDPVHPGLVCYADADWANDPVKRKSTSGYVVLFNGTPISWYSCLQSVIALSSTEAEYIAAAEATREVVYLRSFVDFIHNPEPGPTTIFEDNQGTIHLVNNPVHHRRSKHIDLRWHYIRDKQELGVIKMEKVHTDLNHADIFTKPATLAVFRRHVDAIMHGVSLDAR